MHLFVFDVSDSIRPLLVILHVNEQDCSSDDVRLFILFHKRLDENSTFFDAF